MARRLTLAIFLVLALGGCGDAPFVTATPPFARFGADEVLRSFAAAGLRVEGAQPLAPGALGTSAPRYAEARSFAAGKSGSATAATLFTFDSAADLQAMETYLRQHYTKGRIVTHRNLLLIFSVPSVEETGMYDPVLLALR